jgi:S1-C subfamily serine protease
MFTESILQRLLPQLPTRLMAIAAIATMSCLVLPFDSATATWKKQRVELGVIVIDHKGELTITHVMPGSPAADGGLHVMDQLVAINGKPIATEAEMVRELQLAADQGDSTTIDIRRDGQMGQVTVNLQRERVGSHPSVGQTSSNGLVYEQTEER